jgi:hypothetical protein
MTSEFRIDKPGVYRRRDGSEVCLWPIFSTRNAMLQWVEIQSDLPDLHGSNGRYSWEHEWPKDIVAYVGPLPADILQRMREALAMAEQQSKLTYEQREKYACDVCGNVPDEEGFIQHGRGCHVVNEDGGGITLVDFDEDPKQ